MRWHDNPRTVEIGVVTAKLRAADFSLLSWLARTPGQWRTASAIIAQVFQTRHDPNTSLVRVHAHAIRAALGPAGWCLQSQRTLGYMFTTNPHPCRARMLAPRPANVALNGPPQDGTSRARTLGEA